MIILFFFSLLLLLSIVLLLAMFFMKFLKFVGGNDMDMVIKLLSTIICEKLIDLGVIKSWYYNGSFVIRYAKREFILTIIERKSK